MRIAPAELERSPNPSARITFRQLVDALTASASCTSVHAGCVLEIGLFMAPSYSEAPTFLIGT